MAARLRARQPVHLRQRRGGGDPAGVRDERSRSGDRHIRCLKTREEAMNAALVLLSLTLWPAAPVAAQVPRDTPPPVIENARRERDLRATVAAGAATQDTYLELARLANLQNRYDDTIAALQAAAALEPDSPEAQHFPAPMCWEYARRDTAPDGAAKLRYLQAGLAAEDRALALKPDYLEAL